MCAVFSRKRNVSDLQFYATAKDIRKYLTRFVMNEKHIPKKYRYVFSIPMINLLHELFKNITQANTIYVTNEAERIERKRYQTCAIANIEEIYQLLDYICETLSFDKTELVKILEQLASEVKLLKAWRKTTKISEEKESN